MKTTYLSLRRAAAEIGIHHATLARRIHDGIGPRALILTGVRRSTIRIQRADLNEYVRRHQFGGR